jgi:uncharacterized repeat protein (TIGR01451 family)
MMATAPPAMGPAAPVQPQPERPQRIGGGRQASLVLTPCKMMAPVGSEVLLRVGLVGPNGRLVAGEPVEWMLSQESVGHFVKLGKEGKPCWRKALNRAPEKKGNDFAKGRTSGRAETITRGTPSPHDDIELKAGETWITLTSAAPGVSRVTAMAPDVEIWDQNRQTATIHWVDTQWVFPPPAVGRTGQTHTLTTTVNRTGDNTPQHGWIVRYQILDGPPAALGPQAQTTVDVTTDASGRASTQITGTSDQPGVTRVAIQVIRPAGMMDGLPQQVVGQGMTSVTWSAPDLSVVVSGPQTLSADSEATYQVRVTNGGDLPAPGVVVTDSLPREFEYVSSSPSAQVFGDRLQWNLGNVQPHETRLMEVTVRGKRGGTVSHCVSAATSDGLSAQGCANTQIFRNSLTVRMDGPQTAQVGERVQYTITVTNRGDETVKNVNVTDRYDAGFRHDVAPSPILRALGDLAAGQSRDFAVTLTVVQAGQLCHTLDVTGDGGHTASIRKCLAATERPRPQPIPSMTVTKTGPAQMKVGESATFTVQVHNTGRTPLANVRISDQFQSNFRPSSATGGYEPMVDGTVVWKIGTIPVGGSVTRHVAATAIAASNSACSRVTVTADPDLRQTKEACVKIVAVPRTEPVVPSLPPRDDPRDDPQDDPTPVGPLRSNTLKVSIADDGDPKRIGQEVTYLIVVENDRDRSDRDVTLTFEAPPQLTFQKIDGPVTQARRNPQTGAIAVLPIREMRVGEKETFKIRLKAIQAGQVKFTVAVSSMRQTTPVVVVEGTTIVGP